MGQIFAFMTGERVTEESAAFGDAEERGWVDPSWSLHEFFESRNYVEPLINVSENDEDLAEYVADALSHLGAYEDNGDGTFYGVDAEQDLETGDFYSYAVHFVRKSFSSERGWHEDPWHPGNLLA